MYFFGGFLVGVGLRLIIIKYHRDQCDKNWAVATDAREDDE